MKRIASCCLIAVLLAEACGIVAEGSGDLEPDAGASPRDAAADIELGTGGDSAGGAAGTGGAAGAGGAGGPGTGGAAGAGGSGGAPGSAVGAACAGDGGCATGLMCVKPTDAFVLGGGPANGYCSRACLTNSDCAPLGATCVGDGAAPAACLLSCTPGPSVSTPTKCGGRRDLACEALVDGAGMTTSGACFPFCAEDTECGSRKCDVGTGSCVDGLPSGLPIGSACTANVTPDPCSGVCVPLEDGGGAVPGLCTALCRFGRLEGCGYRQGALDASASVAAACAIPLSAADDVGDLGLCLQLCDSDDDCLSRDFACDLAATSTWKHGVCLPKTPSDAGTSTE